MKLNSTDIGLLQAACVSGSNFGNLSLACTADTINMWSRWKPVRSSAATMTDALMKAANFGLNVVDSKLPENLTPETAPSGYTYLKPRGGVAEPFRAGDFRNYNTNAKPFCYISPVVWNTASTTIDSLSATPNFRFGTGSGQGQGDMSGMEILPSELNGGSGLDFANMYIGMFVFINGNQYTIFSDKKLGEVSAGNYTTIKFAQNTDLRSIMNSAATGTVWKFIPFFSLTNNPSGLPKFNLPTGDYVTVTKTASLNFAVHTRTLTLISNLRGSLGTAPSAFQEPQATGSFYKPYNGTGEVITSKLHVTFYNDNPLTYVTILKSALSFAIISLNRTNIGVGRMGYYGTDTDMSSVTIAPGKSEDMFLEIQGAPPVASLYGLNTTTRYSFNCQISHNGVAIPDTDTVWCRMKE